MNSFLAALVILLCSATLTGILALLPLTDERARWARLAGAGGAVLASLAGLAGVFFQLGQEPVTAAVPWGLPFGSGIVGLDGLSALFLLPVFGLGLTCACSGHIALRHVPAAEHNQPAHWFFFLLLLFGMALVMSARDAVLFLLAWEIMSLSPFFLIDFNDEDGNVRDAAWVYLVAAHLGVVPLMAFWAFLWQQGGATDFAALAGVGAQLGLPLLSTLFLLSLVGFGAKAGLMPLHVWLPEAHPAAPSHISALLSGAMINAGLYGMIRSLDFFGPLPETPGWWGWLVLIMGIATGCVGILKSLAQSNIKRMLAYSSVENMGIMLIGFGTALVGAQQGNAGLTALGFVACLMHMLNHASFKGLLFLCAGEVLHATGSVRMEQMGGLQKRMPLVGAAFALGAASIACLPPFNGFMGEFSLVLALLDGARTPVPETSLGLLFSLVAVTFISGLALVAFAKVYGITFLGEPRSDIARSPHAPSACSLWPLALPALACIAGGLAGPLLHDAIAPAARQLAQQLVPAGGTPAGALEGARASLATATMAGWLLLLLTVAALAVRRQLLRGRVSSVPTWGCGYQYGNARIQYTDSSFSEPLSRLFGPIMGLKVRLRHDEAALFPHGSSVQISAPDRLRSGLFSPLFAAIERLCNACKIIQHGKIHLYILYIFVTTVALLVWGLNQ